MAKRIPESDPTIQRINISEPSVRRLDPDAVAKSLGAEPCPEQIEGQPGPFTLYALRSELFRRRHSSGGRPGLEGTSFRAKIPVGDQDWQRLETLATALSTEGFSPSPGQIASVLLSLALRTVTNEVKEHITGQAGDTAAITKELAARLGADKFR